MSGGSDEFAHALLKINVAETVKNIGFQSANNSSLEVITDITQQCKKRSLYTHTHQMNLSYKLDYHYTYMYLKCRHGNPCIYC